MVYCPHPHAKKSPAGHSTEGFSSPSQCIRKMLSRLFPVGVIQMCWIAPAPWTSAITKVWPASIRTEGETFQPWPNSRAARAPVPSVAMPPLPFSPVKFSGLIERVWAADKRGRLPRFISKPSNSSVSARRSAVEAATTNKMQSVQTLNFTLRSFTRSIVSPFLYYSQKQSFCCPATNWAH